MNNNDLFNGINVSDDISILSHDLSVASLDTVASASSLFFNDQPQIPHVDSFIKLNNCKYSSLKPLSNKRDNKKSLLLNKKIINNGDDNNNNHLPHIINDIEVQNLFNYIDACGDSNGILTLDEIDVAFRKFHHAENHYSEGDEARKLMRELESMIQAAKLTVPEWFDKFHSGHKSNEHHHTSASSSDHHHHQQHHHYQLGDVPDDDFMTHKDLERAICGLQERLFLDDS